MFNITFNLSRNTADPQHRPMVWEVRRFVGNCRVVRYTLRRFFRLSSLNMDLTSVIENLALLKRLGLWSCSGKYTFDGYIVLLLWRFRLLYLVPLWFFSVLVQGVNFEEELNWRNSRARGASVSAPSQRGSGRSGPEPVEVILMRSRVGLML